MPRINTNPQLSVHDNYKIMNIINPYRFSGLENQFKFTIDTDLGDAQSSFTLPLREGYSYNMIVYWGDGTSSEVNSHDDPNITHNYSLGGEYQISIQGTCQTFYFNNGGDKDKLITIDQWGRTGFVIMQSAFWGCSNLTSINDTDGEWCSNITIMTSMFRLCTSLMEINEEDWNVSNVTRFSSIFNSCISLTDLNTGNWDVSNATNFSDFVRGSNITSIETTNWDTSNVTNFFGFIINIFDEVDIDVSNWNVENVTNFSFFATNSSVSTENYDNLLINFALQDVNTGLTLDMGSSRYSTAGLAARDTLINTYGWIINDDGNEPFQFTIDTNSGDTISSFTLPLRSGFSYDMTVYWGDGDSTDITAHDDSGITHNYATGGSYQITIIGTCTTWYFNNGGDKDKLITIDRWGDTFTSMESAFYGCSNLTTVNDSGGTWCSNVTSFSRTFHGCTSLTQLDVSNWDVSNVTTFFSFMSNSGVEYLDCSNWDVSNVSDSIGFQSFAQNALNLQHLDCGNWNLIGGVVSVNFFAWNCSSLTFLNVSGWTTSNITSMIRFIDSCSLLETIDVSGWDVSNVTNFFRFARASGLNSLDVSNWSLNTGSTINFGSFVESSNLTSLDVSTWNTSNVTDFSGFIRGTDISTLNVGGWNTGNVTDFGLFAYTTSSLSALTGTENWDTSNVTDFTFFAYSTNLNELNVSTWNTSAVTNFSGFIRGTQISELDVSTWDTGNVTSFSDFAHDATSLSALTGTENWNTSNVTNFQSFIDKTNMTSLNVSGWTVTGVTNFTNFALELTIDTADYDVLLNEFASQNVNTGLTLTMGTSQYSTAGETARNTLITTYSWTINDGGCVDCP